VLRVAEGRAGPRFRLPLAADLRKNRPDLADPRALRPVALPEDCNYVAAFLTLGCNLTCSYCINHLSGEARRTTPMKGRDWIAGLNRLALKSDLPVTLQGGEPSLHPHFIDIIVGLDPRIRIDILTNLQFDPHRFVDEVPPDRLNRDAPYAPIRVSYHPETMELEPTIGKIEVLTKAGFQVGLYSVDNDRFQAEIERARQTSIDRGIDFRMKDMLGPDGTRARYKYAGATGASTRRSCRCRTTELLISPSGTIHRCHHDLYNGILPLASILDEDLAIENVFRDCAFYGNCNPCDVKVKNNRHQIFGHTSVEIIDIAPESTRSTDSSPMQWIELEQVGLRHGAHAKAAPGASQSPRP
jgi:hypothetical protein